MKSPFLFLIAEYFMSIMAFEIEGRKWNWFSHSFPIALFFFFDWWILKSSQEVLSQKLIPNQYLQEKPTEEGQFYTISAQNRKGDLPNVVNASMQGKLY